MSDQEISVQAYWNILWRNRKRFFINLFVASVIAIIVSLLLPKWYRASAVILPPAQSPTMSALQSLGGFGLSALMGGSDEQNRFLTILQSNQLHRRVVKQFDLINRYEVDNMDLAVEALRSNLIFVLGNENQITVSVYDKDQDLVAPMTSYVVYCLDSLNIALASSQAASNREFIELRLKEVQDSLITLSSEITRFMQNEGILSLRDQIKAGVEMAAALKTEISTLEVTYDYQREVFGETNALTQETALQIESMLTKYQQLFHEGGTNGLVPRMDDIPDLLEKVTTYEFQLEYLRTLYQYLGPQYEQSRIEEKNDVPTLVVVDPAVRPDEKAKPRRALIVIGVFILTFIVTWFYIVLRGGGVSTAVVAENRE